MLAIIKILPPLLLRLFKHAGFGLIGPNTISLCIVLLYFAVCAEAKDLSRRTGDLNKA